MHGRTLGAVYGHADLETLHKVARILRFIIANGDIRTVQGAKQRIEEVGVLMRS